MDAVESLLETPKEDGIQKRHAAEGGIKYNFEICVYGAAATCCHFFLWPFKKKHFRGRKGARHLVSLQPRLPPVAKKKNIYTQLIWKVVSRKVSKWTDCEVWHCLSTPFSFEDGHWVWSVGLIRNWTENRRDKRTLLPPSAVTGGPPESILFCFSDHPRRQRNKHHQFFRPSVSNDNERACPATLSATLCVDDGAGSRDNLDGTKDLGPPHKRKLLPARRNNSFLWPDNSFVSRGLLSPQRDWMVNLKKLSFFGSFTLDCVYATKSKLFFSTRARAHKISPTAAETTLPLLFSFSFLAD